MSERKPGRRISRRTLLTAAGGLGVTGAAAAIIGREAFDSADTSEAKSATVAFYGDHQSGIATAAQHYLHFASFDITSDSRDEVAAMLRDWTTAAARMTEGDTAIDLGDHPLGPPEDTGEALGLTPASLTITFGFGPTFFTRDGEDRYALAGQRPAELVDIPGFRGDALDPARTGGDICIQACADDPQVAFHAVRNLTRIGRGVVVMRWSQLGFNRTATTSREQSTPRNLMGFKDGTNNIVSQDGTAMTRHVWAGDEAPSWMRGGTYLVARRIRMTIEHWDRTALAEQERVIGRTKVEGAPHGGQKEFDTVDLNLTGDDGKHLIDEDAHIRLVSPEFNGGQRILRRGYSFTDGMDRIGELDAGLFFICFQRDPRAQFIPIQQQAAQIDALNEYIKHTGSGVFACPPGIKPGQYIGQSLLEA